VKWKIQSWKSKNPVRTAVTQPDFYKCYHFANVPLKTQRTIQIFTPANNGLCDITRQVEAIVAESGVQSGMVNVYAQGATAGITILSF
jgi:hypothetical protein